VVVNTVRIVLLSRCCTFPPHQVLPIEQGKSNTEKDNVVKRERESEEDWKRCNRKPNCISHICMYVLLFVPAF